MESAATGIDYVDSEEGGVRLSFVSAQVQEIKFPMNGPGLHVLPRGNERIFG
jgi:hypothetical protein